MNKLGTVKNMTEENLNPMSVQCKIGIPKMLLTWNSVSGIKDFYAYVAVNWHLHRIKSRYHMWGPIYFNIITAIYGKESLLSNGWQIKP